MCAGAPQCYGVTSLSENDTTELTCNSTFVGELNPVKMQWFHRHANTDIEESIKSRDRFEIRVAERSVVVPPVSYRDDGAVYTCRMMMDQVTECHVTINVARKWSVAWKAGLTCPSATTRLHRGLPLLRVWS